MDAEQGRHQLTLLHLTTGQEIEHLEPLLFVNLMLTL